MFLWGARSAADLRRCPVITAVRSCRAKVVVLCAIVKQRPRVNALSVTAAVTDLSALRCRIHLYIWNQGGALRARGPTPALGLCLGRPGPPGPAPAPPSHRSARLALGP